MKQRRQLTLRHKYFAVMLRDQTAFMRHFWSDDITRPPSTRQKLFWNDVSDQVLLATGRKTGKTLSVEARIVRNSLVYSKHTRLSERMFAAPGEQQINPTLSRIYSKIQGNPLFRLLKAQSNKNEGVLKWHTNVVWHMRIEGTSGDDRNMVGLRLDEIIFDETAFTIKACHSSRKQSALPGCRWFYAGVPNSVRHTVFWELDQTKAGAGWSHHKFSTYTNPLYWNEKERDRLLQDYGGRDDPDYTTQVMGAWGVELFSSFPPGSMLVDETLPYRIVHLSPSEIPDTIEVDQVQWVRLLGKLQLPKVKAVQIALGMDYGYHQDPTEIGLAYRTSLESTEWKMLMRIHVIGADPLAQGRLLYFLGEIIGRERLARACIDMNHAGIAVAKTLTGLPKPLGEYWQNLLLDSNAGGIVEIDDPLSENRKKKVRRKQWMTQELQSALLAAKLGLDSQRQLVLAKDDELVQELIDTREQKTPAGNVVYVPRSVGKHMVVDHITDMLRSLIVAVLTATDDSLLNVVDGEDGPQWSANPFRGDWRPAALDTPSHPFANLL